MSWQTLHQSCRYILAILFVVSAATCAYINDYIRLLKQGWTILVQFTGQQSFRPSRLLPYLDHPLKNSNNPKVVVMDWPEAADPF